MARNLSDLTESDLHPMWNRIWDIEIGELTVGEMILGAVKIPKKLKALVDALIGIVVHQFLRELGISEDSIKSETEAWNDIINNKGEGRFRDIVMWRFGKINFESTESLKNLGIGRRFPANRVYFARVWMQTNLLFDAAASDPYEYARLEIPHYLWRTILTNKHLHSLNVVKALVDASLRPKKGDESLTGKNKRPEQDRMRKNSKKWLKLGNSFDGKSVDECYDWIQIFRFPMVIAEFGLDSVPLVFKIRLSSKQKSDINDGKTPVVLLDWIDGKTKQAISKETMNSHEAVVYEMICLQTGLKYRGGKVSHYGAYMGGGREWKDHLEEYYLKTGQMPIIVRMRLKACKVGENYAIIKAEERKALLEVKAATNDEYANSTNDPRGYGSKGDSEGGGEAAESRFTKIYVDGALAEEIMAAAGLVKTNASADVPEEPVEILSNDNEKIIERMKRFVNGVLIGRMRAVLVSALKSDGGFYFVRKSLEEHQDSKYALIDGPVTPMRFYMALHDNRKQGKILLFSEIDSLFETEQGCELFKASVRVFGNQTIAWNSNTVLPVEYADSFVYEGAFLCMSGGNIGSHLNLAFDEIHHLDMRCRNDDERLFRIKRAVSDILKRDTNGGRVEEMMCFIDENREAFLAMPVDAMSKVAQIFQTAFETGGSMQTALEDAQVTLSIKITECD